MDYIGTTIHFILERMLNDLYLNRELPPTQRQPENEIMETAWSEIKRAIKQDKTHEYQKAFDDKFPSYKLMKKLWPKLKKNTGD